MDNLLLMPSVKTVLSISVSLVKLENNRGQLQKINLRVAAPILNSMWTPVSKSCPFEENTCVRSESNNLINPVFCFRIVQTGYLVLDCSVSLLLLL
jgi:hypothetical protein